MNLVLDKLAVSVCLLFVSAAKRLAPMTVRNKIGKFVLCFVVTVKTWPSWQSIETYWPEVRIFLGRCAWVKWKCEYPILRRCEWLRRFFPKGIARNLKKNYNNGLVCENKKRLTFCSDQKVNAWHLVFRWNNVLCKLNSSWSKRENRCYFLLFINYFQRLL